MEISLEDKILFFKEVLFSYINGKIIMTIYINYKKGVMIVTNKAPEVIVTGDINLNLLLWQKEAAIENNLNYKLYPSISRRYEAGGALLLAELVSLSTGLNVASPSIKDENISSSNNILVSIAQLNKFPADNGQRGSKVYRVDEYSGFYIDGPEEPRVFSVINDNKDAKIVVLDDDNNGFSSNESVWPLAIKEAGKTPTILYKTNKIDFNNKLWMHIEKNHLRNTIVIINAEDLRAKGVNISKGLSWEKTALDFVWQMKNNPKLKYLANCTNLIIPFGLEGVIYYHKELNAESKLYFLTDQFEGGFIKEGNGKMYGLTSCFVAGLVKAIVNNSNEEELPDLIDEGIRLGMVSAQRYYINGFGSDLENDRYSDKSLFEYDENGNVVRPLSIAVFGTPGSGKSFGVTEVAASIAPNLIKKIDFNLSQFQSVNDLIAAFHN